LVTSICNESYFIKNFKGIDYVYFDDFADEKFVNSSDILDISAYMPKIPIQKETKQFRPIIKSAIEDILTSAGSPISINVLIDTVYKLFDQHSFNFYSSEENNIIEENSITTRDNFDSIIEDILKDLNKADAQCIYACIFQNQEKLSLSEMAKKLDLPKSTLHHKVEAFKKKIVARYKPENEQVGSVFIQKLADALDKLVK
jgi:predicted transcriptional regulator